MQRRVIPLIAKTKKNPDTPKSPTSRKSRFLLVWSYSISGIVSTSYEIGDSHPHLLGEEKRDSSLPWKCVMITLVCLGTGLSRKELRQRTSHFTESPPISLGELLDVLRISMSSVTTVEEIESKPTRGKIFLLRDRSFEGNSISHDLPVEGIFIYFTTHTP